jgi:hypothetical protein
MINKYPGKQSKSDLWSVKQDRIERYINNHVLPFVRVDKDDKCLDVGELNPRGVYLAKRLGVKMVNWDTNDLNFDPIPEKWIGYFDSIFCMDLFEHIQNGLAMMNELKNALSDNGSIYVNLPENAMWLWGEEHYFEIGKDHFIKWILNPLGLHVVRQRKIFFIANWRAFFIGVRPLLRVLRGETTWRSMARSMFCWNFRIYEIKKDI